MSSDKDKFRKIFVDAPTYIQDIFKLDEKIYLLHEEHVEKLEEEIFVPAVEVNKENTNLELTGNPLEVSLKDDDKTIQENTVAIPPNNWTEEEEKYFPMKTNVAVFKMNELNISDFKSKFVNDIVPRCNWAICDGKDKRKTILIGNNQREYLNFIVYVVGYHSYQDEEMQINYMVNNHKKKFGKEIEVNITITGTYLIDGWNLKKYRGVPAFSNGAFMINTWNNPCYVPSPLDIESANLILQVYAGHKKSPLHHYFRRLLLLNACIQALSNKNKDVGSFCLTDTPCDITTMYDLIKNLLGDFKPKTNASPGTGEKGFRQEDCLDTLWLLLIQNEDVNMLKEALIFLFEEIAETVVYTKYMISDIWKCNIANIIRGIINGKVAVPSLTVNQALVLLIDFGFEKMKLDYLHLIEYFDSYNAQILMGEYNKHMEKVIPDLVNPRKTVVGQRNAPVVSRMTRLTKQASSSHLEAFESQLNYLTNLHMIVEYLKYAEKCKFPQIILNTVRNNVFQHFSLSNTPTKFKLIQNGKLFEINTHFNKIDTEIELKTYNLQSRFIKLSSSPKKGIFLNETIFLQCEKPIFPPCVFDGYGIPDTKIDEKMYYVYEGILMQTKIKTC